MIRVCNVYFLLSFFKIIIIFFLIAALIYVSLMKVVERTKKLCMLHVECNQGRLLLEITVVQIQGLC